MVLVILLRLKKVCLYESPSMVMRMAVAFSHVNTVNDFPEIVWANNVVGPDLRTYIGDLISGH